MNRELWRVSFANLLDKEERRMASKFRSLLKREYNKAIDQAVEAGGMQSMDGLFKEQEIKELYIDLYRTIGMRFASWYEEAYEKLIKKSNGNRSTWATTFAGVGEREAGKKIVIVQGTAKDQIRRVIGGLFKDADFTSEGSVVQGRILRQKFNEITQYQAERIVRTESTNAANQAVMKSATDLFGANALEKEWIASADERTRNSHRSMDGQRVPYDEPFKVPAKFGVDLMMHPADPNGSAANVINCRCSMAMIPKEDAMLQEGVELEGFGGGLAAQGTRLIGDELVSTAKPAKEVVEEAVEYEFKPSNFDEFAAGQVKDDSYLGLLKKDWKLKTATEEEGSAMMPNDGAVRIYLGRHKETRAKILAHEFGHAVDDDLGWTGWRANQTDPRIKKLMSKQAKDLGYKRGGKLDPLGQDLQKKWGGGDYNVFLERERNMFEHEKWIETQRSKFPKLSDEDFEESVGAVADWLGSVTTNTIGWGHKQSYMKKPYLRAKEFIAHSFENKYVGNEVFRYYFPQQYQETIDLLDELIKESKYDFIAAFNRLRKAIS